MLQAGFLSFRSLPLLLQPFFLSLSHFLVCTLCLTHPTPPSVIWQCYNLESFLFSSNSFEVHTSPSLSILLHLLALLPAVCVHKHFMKAPCISVKVTQENKNHSNYFFIFLFFYFLFLAVLGLRFCARAFSSCGERGPLFIAVRRPLTVVASPVAEHGLQTRRLSSCGSRA